MFRAGSPCLASRSARERGNRSHAAARPSRYTARAQKSSRSAPCTTWARYRDPPVSSTSVLDCPLLITPTKWPLMLLKIAEHIPDNQLRARDREPTAGRATLGQLPGLGVHCGDHPVRATRRAMRKHPVLAGRDVLTGDQRQQLRCLTKGAGQLPLGQRAQGGVRVAD